MREMFWPDYPSLALHLAERAFRPNSLAYRAGPMKLPNNCGWLLQIDDPQGAKIMLVGTSKKEHHGISRTLGW